MTRHRLTVFALVLVLGLLSCSAPSRASGGMLAASGQVIRDLGGHGKVVALRGTNLGGWLLQEGWMSPAGEASLDRTGWVAAASSSAPGDPPSAALDGDPATRWSSGRPQAAGDTFTVTLPAPTTFDAVVLDSAASTGDAPSAFRVEVSDDATTWRPVGSGTGAAPRTLLRTRYETARFVRVVLTAAKPSNWWSVADLRLQVSDEYNLRRVLTARFGEAQATALIRRHQTTWVQDADLAAIAGLGLNLVRVPVDWQVLMRTDGTMRPDAEAFDRLDWVVDAARRHGLWVLFDLHGTPGANCPWHSCGRAGSNQLWTSTEYQDRTVRLWQRISERYRGDSTVAGYDLLNEPLLTSGAAESAAQVRQKFDLYDRLYRAVRSVDPEHIIFIAAFYSFGQALPPSTYGWTNVVYETHHYDFAAQDDEAATARFADAQVGTLAYYRALWNVPVYAGEFWMGGFDTVTARWLKGLDSIGASWSTWTYKATGAPDAVAADGIRQGDGWGLYGDCPARVPDIDNDSAAAIGAAWEAFRTTCFTPDTGLMAVLRSAAAQPVTPAVPGTVEAEDYSRAIGVQTEPSQDTDGGLDVGWVDAGDRLDYDIDVTAAGTYDVTLRLASPSGAVGGISVVRADGRSYPVSVPATGGWQTWSDVVVRLDLSAGRQPLSVRVAAPGWNLGRLTFTAAGP